MKNKEHSIRIISLLWAFLLISNLYHLFLWKEHTYTLNSTNRTICILKFNIIRQEEDADQADLEAAERNVRIYYGVFFLTSYLLPLISIVILYSLIIIKLKHSKGQQVNKSKRRVTIMVIAVVASFVLCWGPLQVMLFLQHVANLELITEAGATIMVISNCIAYFNTCLNPIIYGFANQDFRT